MTDLEKEALVRLIFLTITQIVEKKLPGLGETVVLDGESLYLTTEAVSKHIPSHSSKAIGGILKLLAIKEGVILVGGKKGRWKKFDLKKLLLEAQTNNWACKELKKAEKRRKKKKEDEPQFILVRSPDNRLALQRVRYI